MKIIIIILIILLITFLVNIIIKQKTTESFKNNKLNKLFSYDNSFKVNNFNNKEKVNIELTDLNNKPFPTVKDIEKEKKICRGMKGDIGERGIIGLQGNVGPRGERGNRGSHGKWPNSRFVRHCLQFKKCDGSWGKKVCIRGPSGERSKIPSYKYDYNTTRLRFTKNDDDEYGEIIQIENPIGNTGQQGPVGESGDPGNQGPTGLQGEQGIQGPQGPRGSMGEKGNKGLVGPRGLIGLPGVKGDMGDVGDEGPTGLAGKLDGLRGPKGPQGDPGPIGPIGPIGLRGKNAQVDTELVKKMISSTSGEKGPRGPKGPKGERGDQGDQGPKGFKGGMGDKGPPGLQGKRGPIGDKGDKGLKGEKGDTGLIGLKGDRGPTGPPGNKGEIGDDGDQGAKGPKGPQGTQGPPGGKGLPGPKGSPGSPGAPGPQGDPGNDLGLWKLVNNSNNIYFKGRVDIGGSPNTEISSEDYGLYAQGDVKGDQYLDYSGQYINYVLPAQSYRLESGSIAVPNIKYLNKNTPKMKVISKTGGWSAGNIIYHNNKYVIQIDFTPSFKCIPTVIVSNNNPTKKSIISSKSSSSITIETDSNFHFQAISDYRCNKRNINQNALLNITPLSTDTSINNIIFGRYSTSRAFPSIIETQNPRKIKINNTNHSGWGTGFYSNKTWTAKQGLEISFTYNISESINRDMYMAFYNNLRTNNQTYGWGYADYELVRFCLIFNNTGLSIRENYNQYSTNLTSLSNFSKVHIRIVLEESSNNSNKLVARYYYKKDNGNWNNALGVHTQNKNTNLFVKCGIGGNGPYVLENLSVIEPNI